MKYKIYCGDKQYKIPNVKLNGYGDVVKAPWGEEVALKLLDGDTVYLKKDWDIDGNEMPVLYINLESGNCCSVFYISPVNGWTPQSSRGWICTGDLFLEDTDIIRIYKFGDESDIYDTGLDCGFENEEFCRKNGTLAAIIKFEWDQDGDEVWRLVSPTSVKHNGQSINLSSMNDKLFISSNEAWNYNEFGIYYVFESGTEGIGFYYNSQTGLYGESYAGWFGYTYPVAGDQLTIYHCGSGLYDYYDWSGTYFDDWNNYREAIDWCSQEFGKPIILQYNGATWELIQEGDRNDF